MFRLALALGMTVAELSVRMSSREFAEWVAFYQMEPFGEERADLRQAMTTSAVYNTLQAQTKHPKWTKPQDFMPFSKDRTMNERTAQPKTATTADALYAKFVYFAGGQQ